MMFGVSNIALAVEKPVMVEAEVQEEIITEEELETEVEPVIEEEQEEEEIVTEEEETTTEEPVVEEEGCPHTFGEWIYDLTEHDDGSVTYFRYCDCGAYEEMEEQSFCDAGGQYENCEVGRHYWCEEDGIRYCEECGYAENDI